MVQLPEGTEPVIQDRDFVVASIADPVISEAVDEDEEDADAVDGEEEEGEGDSEEESEE